MRADEVPAELVEAAKAAVREQVEAAPGHVSDRLAERIARYALAAVLPEIQAQALREAAGDMHRRWSQDDDGPAAWLEVRAARLTTTTERPTDG